VEYLRTPRANATMHYLQLEVMNQCMTLRTFETCNLDTGAEKLQTRRRQIASLDLTHDVTMSVADAASVEERRVLAGRLTDQVAFVTVSYCAWAPRRPPSCPVAFSQPLE
jgi:hypothetical protein